MKSAAIDRKYGFDLQVSPISATGQQWLALRSGSADIGSGSVLDLLRQRQAGLPARAFTTFQTYNNPVVVPANSPIKSFVDLAGKKVGTPDPSLLDFMIIRAAGKKAFNLDVGTQATPTPASPTLLLELLGKGQVDAALEFSSLTATPVAQGQLRELTTVPQIMQQGGFNPKAFYLLISVTDAWSNAHPGGVTKLHDAMVETFQMLMTQDEPWTALAAEVGLKGPAQVQGYMKSQRAVFQTEYSPQLLDATTDLLNNLVSVAGKDAVGVSSVDPNAFIFPTK
ncbi:MAG: ABC transporter substrate-binding protein [Chloroflexi bacterium]|nr:ABC transporter substrate-binding protein [Chloroflexota bacterium]